MGYHIYAIGKAIRALFADRVTNVFYLLIPSQVDDTLKYFQMGPQQAADKW